MTDKPEAPESQQQVIAELLKGEGTNIIRLHLIGIKVFGPQSDLQPFPREHLLKVQIGRAAERIVELLISELQDRHKEEGGMILKGNIFHDLMLNFGLLQEVFSKAYKDVLLEGPNNPLKTKELMDAALLFDYEMMIALGGGNPTRDAEKEAAANKAVAEAGRGVKALVDGLMHR